ncbi:MAG: hypothetical protein AAF519_10250 [Bacteroidota bacterium]
MIKLLSNFQFCDIFHFAYSRHSREPSTDGNNLKRGKYNHKRNVLKAVIHKAQPIILTVFSTCFGLVPFLIYGHNEVLAMETIGGLLFSIAAVFIALPIFLEKTKWVVHQLSGARLRQVVELLTLANLIQRQNRY